MIRSELLQKLADENPELKPEEIEKILDLFFNQIMQKLAEGGRVELRGFGAFSTRQRKPRIGRNPRTGESVEVPVTCRLDTAEEVSVYAAGGVLQRFAQDFLESSANA